MSTAKPTYQDLKDELDNILLDLQRDDIDVDKALIEYKRGLELINQLSGQIKDAENTIVELQAKFPSKA